MAAATAPLAIKVLKHRPDQDPSRDSFVGGRPKLPPDEPLPTGVNCRAILTFFFQVAFPPGQRWAGKTLAVFACTVCQDEAHPTPYITQKLIPSLKQSILGWREDVPAGALDLVQRTFRLLGFDTADGVSRGDYTERVAHRPISLLPQPDGKNTLKSKVGGVPGWVQEMDSSPGKYLGQPLEFLMQWRRRFEFDRVANSPSPLCAVMEWSDLFKDQKHYDLFVGSQLHFFGNMAGGRPNVYMSPCAAS